MERSEGTLLVCVDGGLAEYLSQSPCLRLLVEQTEAHVVVTLFFDLFLLLTLVWK